MLRLQCQSLSTRYCCDQPGVALCQPRQNVPQLKAKFATRVREIHWHLDQHPFIKGTFRMSVTTDNCLGPGATLCAVLTRENNGQTPNWDTWNFNKICCQRVHGTVSSRARACTMFRVTMLSKRQKPIHSRAATAKLECHHWSCQCNPIRGPLSSSRRQLSRSTLFGSISG